MNKIKLGETEAELRITNPTRYDKAPYGSLSKVEREDGSVELYVQVAESGDHAYWVTIGELLAITECIDVQYISEALEVFTDNLNEHRRKQSGTLLYP